jgi:hypothetical protein
VRRFNKYSTTEEDAAVIDITYNTIMNKVSYLPDNIKYFMQQQNDEEDKQDQRILKDPDPSKLALDMGDDDETDDGVGEGSIGMNANVKEVEASNAMNAI